MAQPDLLGIIVKDMATSLKFYRLLGLDIPAEKDTEDHVEVTLPGGFRLAWDQLDMIKSFNPHWVEPRGHRMGLAFKCENAAEVDSLYQRVLSEGFHSYKEPWDAFWGQRYAIVLDPDDNPVDLFAWV